MRDGVRRPATVPASPPAKGRGDRLISECLRFFLFELRGLEAEFVGAAAPVEDVRVASRFRPVDERGLTATSFGHEADSYRCESSCK